jgi:glutaredoxin-related protein
LYVIKLGIAPIQWRIKMAKVEIYTKSWCGYSKAALRLLDRKGVQYTHIDVTDDPGS